MSTSLLLVDPHPASSGTTSARKQPAPMPRLPASISVPPGVEGFPACLDCPTLSPSPLRTVWWQHVAGSAGILVGPSVLEFRQAVQSPVWHALSLAGCAHLDARYVYPLRSS